MDPFLGEIRPVPYSFAPTGWMFCQGQILPISQYTALFSLLGTNFGGNGINTFGLPDLRSNVPLGAGNASYQQFGVGETGGDETVSLTSLNVPSHNHNVEVAAQIADTTSPVGALPAPSANAVYNPAAKDLFAPNAIASAGQGNAHTNIQPFTAINYIIAMTGIFPQRS